VNVPPSPRRRKVRLVRDERPPDDALVVLRAAAPDRSRTLRNAVLDATESGATYVVARGGRREVLYGISVFACRADGEPAQVLSAFPLSPHHLELTVGLIREAGFDVIATGTNPDHYDVQLMSGRFEDEQPEATPEELRGAVARLLWAAGDLKPNPAYAGGDPGPEDER
jgi:hypothetical protein